MAMSKLIERVRNLILTPAAEWPAIAAEPATKQQIYVTYVVPLAALAAVCAFISAAIVGMRVPMMGALRLGMGASLGIAVMTFVMSVVSVFLVALIADLLAPNFGGSKNDVQATKAVAYSYTASWVASVPALLPWIGWVIALAGLIYGIYLLYLGLQHCMKSPSDKATGYTAATVVVAIIASIAVNMLIGRLALLGGSSMLGSGLLGGSQLGSTMPPDAADVRVDADSAAGQLAQWGARVEAAGKQAQVAQNSADPAAAVAAATGVLGAVLGGSADGKPVPTLSVDAIKALLPASVAGLQRRDLSAERNAMGGFQVSVARAHYGDGAAQDVEVEVSDFGGGAGLMALAGIATSLESEKVTESGYEKSYHNGDQFVHEQWNRRDSSGEYTVLSGKRFAVKVSGKAASVDALKGVAAAISLPTAP